MEARYKFFDCAVAPRAGAWIEIPLNLEYYEMINVAPRAGAWIEISKQRKNQGKSYVAPRAGAWIEMKSP